MFKKFIFGENGIFAHFYKDRKNNCACVKITKFTQKIIENP